LTVSLDRSNWGAMGTKNASDAWPRLR